MGMAFTFCWKEVIQADAQTNTLSIQTISIKFRPFSSITYLSILPFGLYSSVFVPHFPLQDWCFLFNKNLEMIHHCALH